MARWSATATIKSALAARAAFHDTFDGSFDSSNDDRSSTQSFGDGMADTMAFDRQKTQAIIKTLAFSKVQLFRSLLIGLGAFSVALAVMMILRILFDSRSRAKLEVTMKRRRFGFLESMHPAETFPFVLAIAVTIQQSIFIGVQTTGLDSFAVDNCAVFASVLLPSKYRGFIQTQRRF
jgi:hypothetical protein